MNYWIKTNADGLVSEAPLTEAKDGYTEVDVPVTSAQYFTRYWQAYRYDGSKLLAPANLPNLDIDALRSVIDQQQKQIESLTTDNQGLQKALGEATQAQVTAQQQFTTTSQTFQQQFGDLTKQLVGLTQQVAALTPAK